MKLRRYLLSSSLLFALPLIAPAVAFAQASAPTTPPPKLITYRGLQMGVDVTAGRTGEAAFYIGASGNHGMLGVRFSQLDRTEAVPCSVGVMYEHMFSRDRARFTPVAGATLSRVFSCPSEGEIATSAPTAHSIGMFSAGVRIPMFAGHRIVGALKVTAYAQRHFAAESANDRTGRGVSVGFVLGRR